MKIKLKWSQAVFGCVFGSAISILAACDNSNSTSTATQSQKPVVLISIDPSSIVRGSIATIQWSATDATECLASGEWYGARPISGSEHVTPHDSGRLAFTLSCTGSGGSATNTAKITVLRGVSPL
jgi:hypothetical protein